MSDNKDPETIEGKWVTEKESLFTPLAGGRVTYDGEKAVKCQCEVEITLNGEDIKPGDTFQVKHGDRIDQVIDPITAKDLKWRFRDEDE